MPLGSFTRSARNAATAAKDSGMPRRPPGPGRFTALRGLRPGRGLVNVPAFFRAAAERYGPVASWPFGLHRFYYVSDPAVVEELLVARAAAFVKGRGTQRLERLLGRGLLTSNGAFHLSQRRIVAPAFHRARLAGYGETMVRRADRLAAGIADGASVPVARTMNRLMLAIAADTLFGMEIASDAEDVGAALDDAMAAFPIMLLPFGRLLEGLPLRQLARFRTARRRLDAIVYRIIAERRRHPGDRGDLLSRLLAMPDEQVRDEALTLLLAGHETTANALTWTWALLAAHPAVQERVAAEAAGLGPGRLPAAGDVAALGYVRDVVAEVLRLYPPAWVLGRQAAADTQLGGWPIPRHSLVVTSQHVMHRDPRFWREPEAFRPERWSNGETDGLPGFAYFPFGGGNRVCVGEGFAWTELILVVATLARRLRFEAAGPLPAPSFSVTLRPSGPVALTARLR